MRHLRLAQRLCRRDYGWFEARWSDYRLSAVLSLGLIARRSRVRRLPGVSQAVARSRIDIVVGQRGVVLDDLVRR
jgi:hypothetical protein